MGNLNLLERCRAPVREQMRSGVRDGIEEFVEWCLRAKYSRSATGAKLGSVSRFAAESLEVM